MRLFSQIFPLSPKGVPHLFLRFCNWMDVQKILKGPFFYIFWHYATYRRLQKSFEKKFRKIFSSIFSFLRGFVVSGCGKSGYRVLCVPLEVKFGTVKLIKKTYFFEPWAGRRCGPFPACFQLCETFSDFFVAKGSPFSFLIFCNWIDVEKAQRVPFTFSALRDC